MARPIWNGVLSFGLLNVPVSVMSGERKVDLHFRMPDARDNKPIRYERVNSDTGEEVPWKNIVNAFEYAKGNYIVLKPEDIQSAAPESHESIDIEAFVEAGEIAPAYHEKPYVFVPGKKATKGYVLLRDTLNKTGRVGVGRVVIRAREYLCAVFPQDDALVMDLLRYPQELVDVDDYKLPSAKPAGVRISKAKFDMAEKLIESMSSTRKPSNYSNEFRERLTKVIAKRMKSKGVTQTIEQEPELPENATTNVVDFMALLRKSLASNKRTPAKSKSVDKPKKTTNTRDSAKLKKSSLTKRRTKDAPPRRSASARKRA